MNGAESLPVRCGWAAALLASLSILSSCGTTGSVERRVVLPHDRESLDERSPYIKAHMQDGRVYVLGDWRVDEETGEVLGHGTLWDSNREPLEAGPLSVPIDSVAIFETNVFERSSSIGFMTVVTGISLGVTIACIANPKACFGSCPTFYVGEGASPDAEGFSSSIAPSLEATDVDVLTRAHPDDRTIVIEMRNEALETHVVRWVDLLLARKPPNGRVFSEPSGALREVFSIHPLGRAAGPEGDCTEELSRLDGIERERVTHASDLAVRESIEIEFDFVPDGSLGLVIGVRQSLLSTFLLYQTLAYMGDEPGRWIAELEKSPKHGGFGPWSVLGGIDVEVMDEKGRWVKAGTVNETGPLASQVHLVALPSSRAEPGRARLSMARGHWRVDWVALARIGETVEPVRIRPSAVSADGTRRPEALAALNDSTRVLTTFPGERYEISYDLPREASIQHEFLLESRGYYLEWIRKEWMEEGDPIRLARMFFSPREALRELAPEFKRIEVEMDEGFWSSRYAKP
jgi:hypothetical protein